MQTILFLLALISLVFIYFLNRFNVGQKAIENEWDTSNVKPIKTPGSTKGLEILPLIDWYTKSNDFIGEAGVSYLIKTDAGSILFDVGFNQKNKHPSPLQHNMSLLNISLASFDTIFISHNHLDHVGGLKNQKNKTFDLGEERIDLRDKKVFTPLPMSYNKKETQYIPEPFILKKGVCSIGIISNFDFFMGRIEEQALAINIEGKGIVLIVGCGHQGIIRILERCETLFKLPIYGIVGGLHYPVSGSRIRFLGMKMQKILGTCRLPWLPFTQKVVAENIDFLKTYKPGIVAISAHDSCDLSLDAFRSAFPTEYREIVVGETIKIS